MSRQQQWPYSLRQLELFADATNAELERAGSLLTMVSVDAGTVVINEGTIGLEFLIIADGTASVSTRSGRRSRVVAELGTGDFAGEMSLLTRNRRSATVTALTPLTVYVCNSAEFSSLLDAAPSVGAKITAAASRRTAALAA